MEIISQILKDYKSFTISEIPEYYRRGVCDYLDHIGYTKDEILTVVSALYDLMSEEERNGLRKKDLGRYFLLPPIMDKNNKLDRTALNKRIEILERYEIRHKRSKRR